MPKDSLETRYARLDERQEALSQVVYEIKDNHLVHLAADVREVKDKVDKIGITIAKWTGGIGVLLWLAGKVIEKLN